MTAVPEAASPAWHKLYRTAGAAGLLFVLSGVTALVLYAVNPPPVTGGEETLRFIADHKASYVTQQILWLVPSLFGLLVFVALLVVLFRTSPSLAVLGFTIGAASWTALLAVPVTSVGALPLVFLSDGFAATDLLAEQSSLAAAAEAFVAENNSPSLAGVLTPVGILLISGPMTRGPLPRWAGWLGIVTGAVGIAAEALRFAAPAVYAVYGPLLWAWFVVVGIALLRLPLGDGEAARGTPGAPSR